MNSLGNCDAVQELLWLNDDAINFNQCIAINSSYFEHLMDDMHQVVEVHVAQAVYSR